MLRPVQTYDEAHVSPCSWTLGPYITEALVRGGGCDVHGWGAVLEPSHHHKNYPLCRSTDSCRQRKNQRPMSPFDWGGAALTIQWRVRFRKIHHLCLKVKWECQSQTSHQMCSNCTILYVKSSVLNVIFGSHDGPPKSNAPPPPPSCVHLGDKEFCSCQMKWRGHQGQRNPRWSGCSWGTRVDGAAPMHGRSIQVLKMSKWRSDDITHHLMTPVWFNTNMHGDRKSSRGSIFQDLRMQNRAIAHQ